MVAEREGADSKIAGPSSAVAAGGGQSGDSSGTGLAPSECVRKIALGTYVPVLPLSDYGPWQRSGSTGAG